jgi:asparagine synthase (glutamine-hydrolysing)
MCGIAGEFSLNQSPAITSVEKMVSKMINRGPDSQNIYSMNHITFGHARLSIIDLNKISNQPFIDSSGRYMITFNGEIYNFKDVRSQLEKFNIHFSTNSDTEVLLEAYKKWGTDCFNKLNGMFAFAIWDSHACQMLIARDRFGKKPLYYFFDGNSFIFASTLNALTAHQKVNSTIDVAAIRQFLSLNYTTTSKCILKGIKKLEPASFLLINQKGSISNFRYWNYVDFFKNKTPIFNTNELYEEIYTLIKDAVNLRMVSDVPVCSFLSGGIDSSLIVKSLVDNFHEIETFTLAFNNLQFDESTYASELASHFKIKNNKVFSDNKVKDSFQSFIKYIDEPFADSSFIPAADLSERSSKFFKVSLVGDGGDEIFAGYETYNADILLKYIEFLPKTVRNSILKTFKYIIPHSFGKIGLDEKIRRLLSGSGRGSNWGHYQWRIIFDDHELRKLFNPDLHFLINDASPFNDYEKFYNEADGLDLIDQSLYVDSKTWLVDDILFKSDRASMMHSQEARCPLLDFRIAERLAQVPVKNKMELFNLKKVLKGILHKKIPQELVQRKKRGFNAPLVDWLKEPLLDCYYEAIEDSRFKSIFNISYLRELMSNLIDKKYDNSHKLYGVLVLFSWIKENNYSLEV